MLKTHLCYKESQKITIKKINEKRYNPKKGNEKFIKKYCRYHKSKIHNIEYCYKLKENSNKNKE